MRVPMAFTEIMKAESYSHVNLGAVALGEQGSIRYSDSFAALHRAVLQGQALSVFSISFANFLWKFVTIRRQVIS